jgi:PPOX class probable F420-dependent enzyme
MKTPRINLPWMPARIPAEFLDLLEGDALAHLATLRADGSPHVTPVWIDHQGDTLLVDVRIDRVKAANMRARPAVAVSIADPRNPLRFIAITGRVVSWSEEGWPQHMDALSRRYLKVERYPWSQPGERREIFRIEPIRVHSDSG